jgi:hypothetical protein
MQIVEQHCHIAVRGANVPLGVSTPVGAGLDDSRLAGAGALDDLESQPLVRAVAAAPRSTARGRVKPPHSIPDIVCSPGSLPYF